MSAEGNMGGRKALMYLGYGAFAVAALVLSLYWTFPTEAVGQRLAHEVRVSTDNRLALSFAELSPYWLSGFSARDVHLRAARAGERPLDVRVDALRARLRLLPLLLLRVSGYLAADIGRGTVEAWVTRGSPGDLAVELELDELELASSAALPTLLGLPLSGLLTADVEARCRSARPEARALDCSLASGGGTMSVSRLRLGPGMIEGVSLPATELGTLHLEVAVDNGKVKVVSYKQEGGAIQAKLSGSVAIKPELASSTLELCLQLRASDTYLQQNPKMGAAMQLAMVRLKKDPQGFIHLPLVGSFASPTLRAGLCANRARD